MKAEDASQLVRKTKIQIIFNETWHDAEFGLYSREDSMYLVFLKRGTSGYNHGFGPNDPYEKSIRDICNEFGTEYNHIWVFSSEMRLAPEAPKPKLDGMFCKECNQFYYMAVSNCSLGLICYSCRKDYTWKYPPKMFT